MPLVSTSRKSWREVPRRQRPFSRLANAYEVRRVSESESAASLAKNAFHSGYFVKARLTIRSVRANAHSARI